MIKVPQVVVGTGGDLFFGIHEAVREDWYGYRYSIVERGGGGYGVWRYRVGRKYGAEAVEIMKQQ